MEILHTKIVWIERFAETNISVPLMEVSQSTGLAGVTVFIQKTHNPPGTNLDEHL